MHWKKGILRTILIYQMSNEISKDNSHNVDLEKEKEKESFKTREFELILR